MVAMCVAVLQQCLELLLWLINNRQFSFLLFASRIFPDQKVESIMKRKLQLLTLSESSVICFDNYV
jgi:hypothetical protein